jgi:Flp pilus assembly protein TadD
VPVAAAVVVAATWAVAIPGSFDAYQLPKLVLAGLAVAVGLTGVAVSGRLPLDRHWWPLLALIAWLGIATFLAADVGVALTGSATRRFGLVQWLLLAGAFAIGRSIATGSGRSVLRWALLVVSLPIALVAVLQRLGLDPVLTDGAVVRRPGSLLGSATQLGAVTAVAVVIGVGALLDRAWRRPALVAALVLDVVALVLSQARGAWIGAAAGIAVVTFAARRRLPVREWATPAAIVAVVALASLLVPGIAGRAGSLANPTEGTAGGRLELMAMGLAAVGDHPVFGWGLDQSRPAMHAHIDRKFEAEYGDDRVEDRAHDVFIDLAVWAGVPAALALGWLLVHVARSVIGRRDDPTVVALGAALVAVAGHWAFNFATPELDVVTFLLLGAVLPAATRTLPAAPSVLAVPVGLIAAGAVLVPSLDALQADRAIARGADAEESGDTVAARAEYTRAGELDPGALTWEVLARFGRRSGDTQLAIDAARRAVAADPTDPYLEELLGGAEAEHALATGDTATGHQAVTRLRALAASSPADGSVHIELGNALASVGDIDAAIAEYTTAAELVPQRVEPVRNLGLMQERKGDVDAAVATLQRALLIDPSDSATLAALERLGG